MMTQHSFNIQLEGYWRDVNKYGIPNHSGIYFVYEATYNEEARTVTLHRILYIGVADRVRDRIVEHEKYKDWLSLIKEGNVLCFSTGPVDPAYMDKVEAAYIFKYKPVVNTENKYTFQFDTTTINSAGTIANLDKEFTV